MTKEIVLEKLKQSSIDGEFSLNVDLIVWYYYMESYDSNTQEPHDKLWDVNCEVSQEIRDLLGEDNIELINHWSDNDSCGFDIKLLKLENMETVKTDLYPEHTKLDGIKEKSQWLGEFLDWANEKGMHLHKYVGDETLSSASEGKHMALIRVNRSINDILSEFLDIDLRKLEEEKQLMLRELKQSQKTDSSNFIKMPSHPFVDLTEEAFIGKIKADKPKELYHSHYSSELPLYKLYNYADESVDIFCCLWPDVIKRDFKFLYNLLKMEDLENFSYSIPQNK